MNSKKLIWLVIIAFLIFVAGAGIVLVKSLSTLTSATSSPELTVTPVETPVATSPSHSEATMTAEEQELQNINVTLPESDFTDLQKDANSL